MRPRGITGREPSRQPLANARKTLARACRRPQGPPASLADARKPLARACRRPQGARASLADVRKTLARACRRSQSAQAWLADVREGCPRALFDRKGRLWPVNPGGRSLPGRSGSLATYSGTAVAMVRGENAQLRRLARRRSQPLRARLPATAPPRARRAHDRRAGSALRTCARASRGYRASSAP